MRVGILGFSLMATYNWLGEMGRDAIELYETFVLALCLNLSSFKNATSFFLILWSNLRKLREL